MATPRTIGFLPNHLEFPAFFNFIFLKLELETFPMVAKQFFKIKRCSLEAKRTFTYFFCI